ncbi:MAG: hypothetical protein CVV41_17040 [Candidatus Riflebacteria bacterium HGW-Riflebacteria-1]|nr:MAG: hypothetical protein CVV41_17040 [Candidatus Riflebacteria bacterium HGW-Riflebacteria-1]
MSIIDNITEWLLSASRVSTLDIGSNCLRWLYGSMNQQTPALQTFRSRQTDAVHLVKDQPGHLFDSNAVAKLLASLVATKYGIENHAAIILPDQAFHFGSIHVPTAAGRSNLTPLLQRDIQKTAPLPINSYVIKHETGKNKGNQLSVQYCALPTTILEEVQRACEMARIVPVSVQPSFVGLIKLLMRHQSISEHPSVFLHIDNESTTMGIYDKNGLRTVNLLDFGFRSLLQAIREGSGCDESAATQALFHEPLLLDDPGASDAQNEIPTFGAIEGPLADFLQKIYGQLLLFGSEHPEENGYSKIVISGEGALIKNLDRLITFNLGIPASVISNELKDISGLTGLPADEKLETLAPALGSLLLQPARKDRFDRIMAA